MLGIKLLLKNGQTPLVNLTGLYVIWWDELMGKPKGKSYSATTNTSGELILDITAATRLSAGQFGYLLVRHPGLPEPAFFGKVAIEVIAGGTPLFTTKKSRWTKPLDWPALTVPDASSQFLEANYAVFGPETFEDNLVKLYTHSAVDVDWGDGVIESYAADTFLSHAYDYTSVNLSGPTTEGFKVATITVTPQAGYQLTGLNFSTVTTTGAFSDYTAGKAVSQAWLELVITSPHLTTLVLPRDTAPTFCPRLARIHIGQNALITFEELFYKLYSLESVELDYKLDSASCYYMFGYCYSLKEVILPNPLITPSVQYLFRYCHSLHDVDIETTATNVEDMFNWCRSLETLNLVFNNANPHTPLPQPGPLWSVRLISTAMTNGLNLFSGQFALREVSLHLPNLINTDNMFEDCWCLEKIPPLSLDGSIVPYPTSLNLFHNCYNLKEFPDHVTITQSQGMFVNCRSALQIPAYDFTADTSTTTLQFSNMNYLVKVACRPLPGNKDIDLRQSALHKTALEEILNNLPDITGSTTRTLYISHCPGYSQIDTSIAAAKNWTVA